MPIEVVQSSVCLSLSSGRNFIIIDEQSSDAAERERERENVLLVLLILLYRLNRQLM
jgi:hypothetical protein